jgi:hypothetical protein
MKQQDIDNSVAYLERVIERCKNNEFYDFRVVERNPLIPDDDGKIVRDMSQSKTLDIAIKVKDK